MKHLTSMAPLIRLMAPAIVAVTIGLTLPLVTLHADDMVMDHGEMGGTMNHDLMEPDPQDFSSWQGETVDVIGARVVDLEGQIHNIGIANSARPAVLVFLDNYCPVSNRYAPELQAFADQAADAGIEFYGVMSDPLITPEEARQFARDYGIGFPVIFDGSGELAVRLDPLATPEAFVIGPDNEVVYRGRIDNRFEAIGVLRNTITSHDLLDTMTALKTGDPLLPERTMPVGCVFEAWNHGMPEEVTYTRDIAPLVNANCVECHRDGGVGPFSFESYEQLRRRATMVSLVTLQGVMPPWRAAHGFGAFRDERHLSERQIALLLEWSNAGAPLGEQADALPEPLWPEDGWQIGEPDLVVEMTEPFDLPATGPDIYRYFVIPFELFSETAIKGMEFRPGDTSVVHHANVFVDYSGRARREDAKDAEPGFSVFGTGGFFDYNGEQDTWGIGGWTPGAIPYTMPDGYGMWLPEGEGDIVFEIHYHLSGKATADQSRMAFYFADEPVSKWVDGFVIGTQYLDIKPEDDDYWRQFHMDIPAGMTLVDLLPHMHYLGKEVIATATLPDGEVIPLIHIEKWDFRWQNVYVLREPLHLPAGSRIDAWFSFDNSSDNPYNPAVPPVDVTWGWGSNEEMCEIWVSFVLDDWRQRDSIISASYDSWYQDASLRSPPPDLHDLISH
ncbi:MAG: redoxin domain-containing protein [Pseudomonadota bacterium]